MIGIPRPPWYDTIEKWLEPSRPLTTGILLVMIAITIWVICQKSNALRALWAVYLVSP